jgi:hypothetical protein
VGRSGGGIKEKEMPGILKKPVRLHDRYDTATAEEKGDGRDKPDDKNVITVSYKTLRKLRVD